MRTLTSLLAALLLLSSTYAQDNSAPTLQIEAVTRLPVTRVILYKNGVGYFEHAGHVRGNQQSTSISRRHS